MSITGPEKNPPPPRRRLSREDRRRQLLDMAWHLVCREGTDALTLGRLADQAGVTKPVVYDHFGTRTGLLAALYQDFDARQTAAMDAALRVCDQTLAGVAAVIAASYIDCCLLQGREIPGVIAALAGSPELEDIKRRYQGVFLDKCRAVLGPFAPKPLAPAALWAMLGAAQALSHAAATKDITPPQAKDELFETIVALVTRSGCGEP